VTIKYLSDPNCCKFAASIVATQTQNWRGNKIPGTNLHFSATIKATASVFLNHPDYSLRCLVAEFKSTYASKGQDLAKNFAVRPILPADQRP
jgi:hypothetical protein